MASETKSFSAQMAMPDASSSPALTRTPQLTNWLGLVEVGIIFGLILIAVWTPQGRFNSYVCWTAALATVVLSLRGRYTSRELGLTRPLSGVLTILVTGAGLSGLIAAIGLVARPLGPPQPLPWDRAWQYGLWALLQQFILQSFMFVRLESLWGARRALWVAAFLFALAHLPSPVLTALSFLGAVFFCYMFRRYRNIYPLGVVHGALGLTIAASLPDSVMHHMRVGVGYLIYHH